MSLPTPLFSSLFSCSPLLLPITITILPPPSPITVGPLFLLLAITGAAEVGENGHVLGSAEGGITAARHGVKSVQKYL